MATVEKFPHPDERGILRRTALCPVADDEVQNANYILTYTGANLTRIDMVIDGDTFRRTLAYTGAVLDTVSKWVKQ